MIVVTAPTSAIGSRLLERLVAGNQAIRVVARDPSRLPEAIRERVEIAPGSHGDPDAVERAFAGADAVFWLVPPDPAARSLEVAYLDFTRPAAQAFARHGVRRVVGISALGRGTAMAQHAGLVTASLAMDDMICASGVSYRALAMPSFMDNVARQAAAIREQGLFFGPIHADRTLPTVATRDIAAEAARLLADPNWSGQEHRAVLGPENLSFNEMARILSQVLQREVHYRQVSLEAFRAQLVGRGMSDAVADGYVAMMRAKNEGLDEAEPRDAANTTPTTFRQWCEAELKPLVLR